MAPEVEDEDRQPVVEIPGEIAWDQEEYGHAKLPIRLYEIPRWRDTGEEKWMEFYVPGEDSWERVKAHWAPVLEGLVEGEALPYCEVRLRDARPDFNAATRKHIVRKVVNNLERLGMAELVTPDPPACFVDRYEVVEQLGRGGMGVVWLCQDLERPGHPSVAVKHAWNWSSDFETAESSIEAEADLLAHLDHPNIVDLVDTFHAEGRLHMAREFIDGQSLSSYCGDPELDGPTRRRMVKDIGHLLADLRDDGWLYLDVSPGNFYVEQDLETPRLADIGVCKEAGSGSVQVSSRAGTRRYAAPEMIGGGKVTERSLIYSLGRLLWRMIMGRIPVARSTEEKVYRQDRAILELLKDSRATPREIEFFDRATRTAPDDRPATIEDALEILEE